MRLVVIAVGVITLAGCQASEQAARPEPVGKYQLIETASGIVRMNTATGHTQVLIPTDDLTIPASDRVALLNGKRLVWAAVRG
jgi:hypothetical protein